MEIRKARGFPQPLENSLEDSAFSQFPQARGRAKYQTISAAAIHLKIQGFLSEEWGAPQTPATTVPGTYVLIVSRGPSATDVFSVDVTIGAVGPPGPQGERGPAGEDGQDGEDGASGGFAGTEIVTLNTTIPRNQTRFVSVSCNPGYAVTGGGFGTGSSGNLTVFQNRPSPTPTNSRTWLVQVRNDDDEGRSLVVHAICVKLN